MRAHARLGSGRSRNQSAFCHEENEDFFNYEKRESRENVGMNRLQWGRKPTQLVEPDPFRVFRAFRSSTYASTLEPDPASIASDHRIRYPE